MLELLGRMSFATRRAWRRGLAYSVMRVTRRRPPRRVGLVEKQEKAQSRQRSAAVFIQALSICTGNVGASGGFLALRMASIPSQAEQSGKNTSRDPGAQAGMLGKSESAVDPVALRREP